MLWETVVYMHGKWALNLFSNGRSI